ncbi:MAG: hypothetical protein HC887_12805 [Desulfobacteraceae bacterium]|nr:hypothetical protein [Desulfobacteraceae bacterium]
MKLHELTIEKASELLHKKEISSRELVSTHLERIESADSKIGAYITVAKEAALEKADISDKAIRDGNILSLTGIPLAVKDVICTQGLTTTCASKILCNFVPPYNATVIGKLQSQGAIIIGKTNMDEFAMGSSTESSAFKLTRNPWDLNRIPGGSSGGSAACIAADMAMGSLGSDTGGSIRIPAAICGLVGMKVTQYRVPMGPNHDYGSGHGYGVQHVVSRSVRDSARCWTRPTLRRS